jgi:hypothetical protein
MSIGAVVCAACVKIVNRLLRILLIEVLEDYREDYPEKDLKVPKASSTRRQQI